MALSSFLERCWEQSRLAAVPPGFVLSTLLPAAGQGHLWRGEGAEELQRGVAGWVGRYAATQQPQERRQLLLTLLGLLTSGGGGGAAQQRPLAQTVAGALAAAAEHLPDDAGAAASSPEQEQQWQLQLLQRLQEATRQLSAGWGAGGPTGSYAVSTCSSLLQVAAATAPLHVGVSGGSQLVLSAAAAWLQQLPLVLLLPGGALHAAAVGWLGNADRQELVPALAACVQQYMEQGGSSSSSSSSAAAAAAEAAPAADRAGWQQQAGGLARLAALVACSEAEAGSAPRLSADDLAVAFASWDAVLSALYRRWAREHLQLCCRHAFWGTATQALQMQPTLLSTCRLCVNAGLTCSLVRRSAACCCFRSCWLPPSRWPRLAQASGPSSRQCWSGWPQPLAVLQMNCRAMAAWQQRH